MIEFNFKSQIATTIEQSERLLSLGLKKETADMVHCIKTRNHLGDEIERHSYYSFGTEVDERPLGYANYEHSLAWSLHRLIEILDTNPCVFYTNCGYDNIIDRIEEYIKEGIIDTRYLEEWCLNEEE